MDNILIIDDEKRIVSMIEEFLIDAGFKTLVGYSSKDALDLINEDVNLAILDVNLGDMDGIDLCFEIRKKYNIPIIFLSAKTRSVDKVKGLNAGADDYITKPFDPEELIARIKANLRRYRKYDNQVIDKIEIGKLRIDNLSKRVYKNNKRINLSNKEYQLLIYLILNKNKVLNRKEILENVWESKYYGLNTVNTNIMRLRNKIDDKENKYIKSVRGRGYVFEC